MNMKAVNRIMMMLVKGQIDSVDDTTQIQLGQLQALEDEVQEGIERLQEFGFTSNPPKGSECLVAYLTGNRDNGLIIKTDSGLYRKTGLLPGETAVYAQFGNYLHLKTGLLNELIGNTTIGAVAGATPLLKVTPTLTGLWDTYFVAAAAGWGALVSSGLFAPAENAFFTAAQNAATAMVGVLAAAQCTLVKGV